MVTDEQYRELQNRVSDLERKLASLSRQCSSLLMRRDTVDAEPKSHRDASVKHDITRYKFEGKLYCKRQLVLACVKKYVHDNSVDSFITLSEAFPEYIQGSLGVVRTINDAERYSEAHKRFYFSDKDVIHLNDEDVVVCSQWDVNNISRFVNLIEDLGYNIETVSRKYH